MDDLTTTDRRLAVTAVLGTATFAVVTIGLPFLKGGRYDVIRQPIDDLATGRAGWAIDVAFALLAVSGIALAALMRRTVYRAVAGPVLLVAAALLHLVMAALPHVPDGQRQTAASSIHETAGVLSMILTIAAMFTLVRTFGRDATWRTYRQMQLVWSATAAVVFIVVSPPVVGDAHFGIAQRAEEALLVAWMIAIAARSLLTEARARGAVPVESKVQAAS